MFVALSHFQSQLYYHGYTVLVFSNIVHICCVSLAQVVTPKFKVGGHIKIEIEALELHQQYAGDTDQDLKDRSRTWSAGSCKHN